LIEIAAKGWQGGEQDAGPDLTNVVAAPLVDALRPQLGDPVADDLRWRAVEDSAGVDDRAHAAVEVLAVQRAFRRVVGDWIVPTCRMSLGSRTSEQLHAACRRQRRHALRDADRVEVARDGQDLPVGRHLLVLPGDVRLHPAQRLRVGGVGDVVDRDVLARGDEEPSPTTFAPVVSRRPA